MKLVFVASPTSGPSFELHITMMLLIKYFRILITGYWEDLINFPLLSPSPWMNKFEFHIQIFDE
jgi:hypothetical protein